MSSDDRCKYVFTPGACPMNDYSAARRRRPANRFGCKPTEDVCVEHDAPLVCRHGCEEIAEHNPCNPRLKDDDRLTVCSVCLRSCCWRGEFMCDDAYGASTVEKTVQELRIHQEFGEGAEEHESFWRDALRESKPAPPRKRTAGRASPRP